MQIMGMKRFVSRRFRLVMVFSLVILMCAPPVMAGSGSDPDGADPCEPPDVLVRSKVKFTNDNGEGETANEEEIIAYCRENMAAYKAPRVVEFRDELPKSLVGKILRRELRPE